MNSKIQATAESNFKSKNRNASAKKHQKNGNSFKLNFKEPEHLKDKTEATQKKVKKEINEMAHKLASQLLTTMQTGHIEEQVKDDPMVEQMQKGAATFYRTKILNLQYEKANELPGEKHLRDIMNKQASISEVKNDKKHLSNDTTKRN